MNKIFFLLISGFCVCCGPSEYQPREVTGVSVTPLLEDSMSVRAIEIAAGDVLWFADDRGRYGYFEPGEALVIDSVVTDFIVPHFRAIASGGKDIFLLGIGSPALLYKIGEKRKPRLVYRENHEKAFYDAMKFWNGKEGIAMGDPTDNCLSVIITRDGGESWSKVPCESLPPVEEGEAAFAASNTNIAIAGNHTWIASGGMRSRIFYSPDKGRTWEVFDTPVIQGEPTRGIYTVDFYDETQGMVMGGDYTRPGENGANKAVTRDRGRTWELTGDGEVPGYRSCVQYIPGTGGHEVVAVGFEGIAFSNNGGRTWEQVSDEPFFTIRFLNDSVAYAAGKGRIARLDFRKEATK